MDQNSKCRIIRLREENLEKVLQDLIITDAWGWRGKTPKWGNRTKYEEMKLQQTTTIYTEGESATEWRDDL